MCWESQENQFYFSAGQENQVCESLQQQDIGQMVTRLSYIPEYSNV